VGERFVGNEASLPRGGEPKALVEAHKMRRGIDVHAQPRRLQDRAHESDGRALAVGPGDMECRRQPPLGMPERGEHAPHAIARPIDPVRMQRGEPRDGGLDGGHVFVISTRPPWRGALRWRTPREPKDGRQPAAGSGNFSTGGFGRALVSSLQRFASVGRRSRRWTTMSTMPWALRYSARWKPSGSFSRMVCSMTRGPAKPMSAPGSARWMSPSMAYDAVTPPVVGLVSTTM